MEQLWGLSGPEFVSLYWIALAGSSAFAILIRVRLRGTRGGDPAGALGIFDIAYLTGGPRRVVETSVAGLITSGALVPARNGAVRVVGTPVADHPVDRAVLADANRYRNRTLTLLITSVSEQDAPRAVGRRLSEMDYLVAPERARSALRLGIVPMVALLVVGVVWWVHGLATGAVVGWLTLQLVLTGVLVVLLLKANPLTRTAAGRAAVAQARAGGNTGWFGGTGSADAVGLVALNGFIAHPDVALRAAVRPRPTTRPRSRSGAYAGGTYSAGTYTGTSGCGSASSCSSSGGSSCGGGGCGSGS